MIKLFKHGWQWLFSEKASFPSKYIDYNKPEPRKMALAQAVTNTLQSHLKQ